MSSITKLTQLYLKFIDKLLFLLSIVRKYLNEIFLEMFGI